MASQLPPLVGVLKGEIGHFAASMHSATAIARETSSSSSAALSGMSAVGKVAFLGIAGAAIAGGAISVKMAGDFQQSMTQLVTGANESKANIGLVSKGLLSMASEVGLSAQELASGMYMVESAGFHGAAGLAVMKTAAQGARVGGADMATVADALTSALNAYHLPASAAVSVTNDLVATVANGKMHMQDLAASLGTVLPAASVAKISLAEVTGAMATMTMQGTPAADAATYLRQTILQLENPSAKAQKAMAGIGLTADQVGRSLSSTGLAGTLDMLTQKLAVKFPADAAKAQAEFAKVKAKTETADEAMAHLSSSTSPAYIAALASMVGGTKSMQAALELTGGNMATFKANTLNIASAANKGGGEVAGWADTQKDFNFQIDQAKAALGAMAIQLGLVLIPIIQKGITVTGQIIGYFKQHKDQAAMLGAAIAGPLAFAIGAYTVSMIAAAAATIAATWPIIAVIAAIALMSAGVVYAYNHWGWFRTAVNAAIAPLKTIFQFLSTEVPPIWAAFTKDVSGAWHGLQAFGAWLQNTFGPILKAMGDGLQKAGGFLNAINPWAKHSPSLVENVLSGTTAIAGHYQTMARSVGTSMASIGPGGSVAGSFSAPPTGAFSGNAPMTGSPSSISLSRNYQFEEQKRLLVTIVDLLTRMERKGKGGFVLGNS